ncbi:MAG: response regulator [bacterium]|nr:MAG: response regulator [bacterium]
MVDIQSVNILICGEDRSTANFLSASFKNENYVFQHVEDIEKAIQHINPGDYHVLLIGLSHEFGSDKLDGLRAIPIVRKIDPSLPIIAIAHDESLETERKARLAGIFYYLLQPLEINEVRMSIMNAVQKYNKF